MSVYVMYYEEKDKFFLILDGREALSLSREEAEDVSDGLVKLLDRHT